MSPDDLRITVTLMAALLIAVGFYLAAAPVGECPSCAHCAQVRLNEAVICPLHRTSRNRCDRYHKDDDGG